MSIFPADDVFAFALQVVGSFIIVSVGSVPLCFCVLARAVNEAKTRWRMFVLRFLTWIAILHYLFAAITQLVFQYDPNTNRLCTNIHGADDPTPGVCYQCIHRGPNGHMVCSRPDFRFVHIAGVSFPSPHFQPLLCPARK